MNTVARHTNRGQLALAWCLSFMFLVALAGCSKETPVAPDVNESAPAAVAVAEPQTPSETVAPATAPAPAEVPAPDAVLVTVNGEDITEQQLNTAVDSYLRRAGAQLSSLPAALIEQYKKQMRPKALDNLVAETLLDQQIEAANIVVTEEQVLAMIEARGAKQNPPVTVDGFKEIVTARGADFGEIVDQYKTNMARQQFLEAQWAGQIDVNDAEAKAYYDENTERFKQDDRVQASHILIKPDTSDPNDPNEAKAVAKAKAEKLLADIKAGADFAELAKTNSADPGSASRGGDLGFFAQGRMVPPFNDAAFALQPGEISDVVETKFGYHIIKVTDRQAAHTTPFEEAKPGIIEQLTSQKKGQFAKEFLQSLKEKATIVYAAGSEPAAPRPMAPAPAAGSSTN